MLRVILITSKSLALAGVVLLATGYTNSGVLCIASASIPWIGYACLHQFCAPAPKPSTPSPPPVVVVDEDPRPVSQNDVLS
jgi:hypothetical protein